MRGKFPLLGPVLEHVNYRGERMAMTAEILTVVTYDGFNTISEPILYSIQLIQYSRSKVS